jgi:hypothetical protein
LDSAEQSAKTTAARIHFNPRVIFTDLHGRPLSNAELSSSVREVLISDKSTLQPVIAALALAMSAEKAAIGTGLGQAMLAVVNSDPSYATDILYALAAKADWIAIAAFVAVTGEVHERAFKDANAESAGPGDRSTGLDIGLGIGPVGSSFAAATAAIARDNTASPALPSAHADTRPTAPEGVLAQNPSAAVVTPVDKIQPAELKVPPTDLAQHAEAIKPMAAPRSFEVAAVEVARPIGVDRPSATTDTKAEKTRWIFSETTSPVDYTPLVSATVWPRQQVNSGLSGLTISCRAKRIALSLRLMGDLDVPRWGEIWIDSQIGDQRLVKQRWIWDEQQGTTLLYDGDPAALLQSIPDGTRLRFGVGDSKGARHMATYHLFDLDSVQKKVASTCGAPSSTVQASSEKR